MHAARPALTPYGGAWSPYETSRIHGFPVAYCQHQKQSLPRNGSCSHRYEIPPRGRHGPRRFHLPRLLTNHGYDGRHVYQGIIQAVVSATLRHDWIGWKRIDEIIR